MGWRKLGDERELCSSLDYVLESVQTLKASIQEGRRLDGEDDMEVVRKEMWCRELFWPSSSVPIVGEDAKAALRRMKDAKKLVTILLKSLDDAIRSVAEASAKTCQAAGFALLPDDILALIFDIFIDMCDMPDSYDKFTPLGCSPQILSSVCRRFRNVAMHLPSLWRNISLTFPKKMLLQHKEKCRNPIIHIPPTRDAKCTRANLKMLRVIQPPHQWRELRLHFSNEDHGSKYFHILKRLVHSPFNSLEHLSICNDLASDATRIPAYSIRPLRGHIDVLSSWRMPKLTHLKLQNFIPNGPIHCENVTSLTFHLVNTKDFVGEPELRKLFDSMPKIEFLSLTFDIGANHGTWVFDETLPACNRPVLPNLKHLDLKIEARTPANAIKRFIALIDYQLLIRFSLRFYGDNPPYSDGSTFERLVNALFPFRIPGFNILPTFANVEEFTLRIESFRGSPHFFERIFTSMPNVREISLALLRDSNIAFAEQWTKEGAFRRLRTLRIEVLPMDPRRSSLCLSRFGAFSEKENCNKFRRMEVRNPTQCLLDKEREELRSLL
ncbi:hypothetical protein SCHPADRAFT_929483, partial [Schizopora paradoxa]